MILLLVSFIAGLLTVLAPCVLPLLPVIVGGSVSGGRSVRRALVVTASLTISVIVFTVLIKASTIFIDVPQSFWQWFSGIIIMLVGLTSLFPHLWERLPFLSKLSARSTTLLSSGYRKQTSFGDIVVGAALGPVFSTCSPTYFLVLAAVLPENFALGMVYLIAYSLGLSFSLLLVSFVGQKVLDKAGVAADPRGWFKRVFGLIFILVGLAIVTGADKSLQIRILDAGFFDVTRLEQKLLEFVPSSAADLIPSTPAAAETETALTLPEKLRQFALAPEISSPSGFVNTEGKPLTLDDLRGKVVLLDIWTYSCINCQRTLPHLNEWYAKYRDQGLEIVGLHTPEFAFEHQIGNVEQAVARFGIEYPVVLDNDYSTWNAYGNRFWPRKYLIDIDGFVVYDHIGEGAYAETEAAIQRALRERNMRLGITDVPASAALVPVQESTDPVRKRRSPEVYFGAERNDLLTNAPRGVRGERTMMIPEQKILNSLYLGGTWNITDEFAVNEGVAHIVFKYLSSDVYIVAGSEEAVDLDIYRDDVYVKSLTIAEEGLHQLIDDDMQGEHVLRIEIKSGGLQAYTFTFG